MLASPLFDALGRAFVTVHSAPRRTSFNDRAAFISLGTSRGETLEGIGGSVVVEGVGPAQLMDANGTTITLQDFVGTDGNCGLASIVSVMLP